MKVITLIADNRALYLLDDEDKFELATNHIVVEGSKIYGLNDKNTTIYYDVEDPLLVFANPISEDSTIIDYSFSHSKFLYDGQTWVLNADWTDAETHGALEETTVE